jgi:hypothetical protein
MVIFYLVSYNANILQDGSIRLKLGC